MIATDGTPTISSPVQTRRPVGGHRQAGSNVSVTRDLDNFMADHDFRDEYTYTDGTFTSEAGWDRLVEATAAEIAQELGIVE